MSEYDSFIDTNILIYAIDTIDIEKHRIAQTLIADLIRNKKAVISTQVLQEFYNVATKKLNIQKEKIFKIIESLASVKTVNTTPKIILNAIDLNIRHQFSFWDSLVLSAAQIAECQVIYTEDMNDRQIVNGVKIVNPFKNDIIL